VNIFGSIILMTLICLYVFKYYIFVWYNLYNKNK
jgi:hypothetical protein